MILKLGLLIVAFVCFLYWWNHPIFEMPDLEKARERQKLEDEVERLNQMSLAYKKQVEELRVIAMAEKHTAEMYKGRLEEIGAEIDVETSTQYDPKLFTVREFKRVRVRYDKTFILEGCDHNYEKLDELDGRLQFLERRKMT